MQNMVNLDYGEQATKISMLCKGNWYQLFASYVDKVMTIAGVRFTWLF